MELPPRNHLYCFNFKIEIDYLYYSKPSLETISLLDNQKVDWEAFHLQSLQYNEEDIEDEEEELILEEDNNNNNDTDDNDEDVTLTKVANVMVNKYAEKENVEEEEEEDEPTTCSICLINRQGPCRYPWKKFERCIKQQVPSSSSSSKDDKKVCDPFFLPWLECFSQHRLTYSILTNQSVQPEMDFLEETHGTQTPFPSDLIPTLTSQHSNTAIAITTHCDHDDLKNNFNDQEQEVDEEEALLLDAMTSTLYQRKLLNIPLINPTTGNTIYVAYVRDEPKGDILGFDYFTTELEQLQVVPQQQHTEEHLTKPIDEAQEDDEKEEQQEDSTITQQSRRIPSTTTGELMFHVPVGTNSVVVHALYKNEMNGEEESKQDMDRTTPKQQQHDQAMKPTETKEIISEKVYVQTITLENNNRT